MVSMASAIKAGLSLAQSLEILADQSPLPIKDEFQQMMTEYQLGKTLDEVLGEARDRLKSENFALFAAAMQGAADAEDLDRAERMMGSSQHPLLEELLREETEQEELHACTDITGFGLLGHLGEMLDDDCRLQLDAVKIPSLNGALELLEAGHCSSLALHLQ